MKAAILLSRIRATGLTVRLDGERIRLRPALAAAGFRDDVLSVRSDLVALLAEEERQLARRVDGFRACLEAGRFLSIAGTVDEGCCLSCGDAWPDDAHGTRCDLCAQAARIVLGMSPELPAASTRSARTHAEFTRDLEGRSAR